MTQFESQNPNIKVELLSGPYASTKQQLVSGAASKTLPDVVGLDGAWVNDFAKQGALTDLSALMAEAKYDESQLASQIKVDDKTYMIPVVNFVYPLFVNEDLLSKAGVKAAPNNRSEFLDAAKKISALGGNVKGWALPLDTAVPNGIQNDVMSWLWASGGSMLTPDGKPNLTSPPVKSTVEYVKSLNDADVIAPGSLTMKEQDKVEKFTVKQVGMMIDSLAHINLIKKNSPDLNFTVAPIPAEDSYTGKRGLPYASWGIGIADSTEHKAEAFKLVEFLMSQEANAQLSTLANGFPGNKTAEPDFSKSDPLFKTAFDIYKEGVPANEFVGLPKSEELMRTFDEQLQLVLTGKQSVDEALSKTQESWASVI
jgi:multiple sugar transport system substrate-binding protein